MLQLKNVALAFLVAGADIVTTATYQVSAELLEKESALTRPEAESVMRSAASILHYARASFWSSLSPEQQMHRRFPAIAASCGPYGALLSGESEYCGVYRDVSKEELVEFHRARTRTLLSNEDQSISKPDIICFETIPNQDEAVAIATTMNEPGNNCFPYWVSFQCRDGEHIANGTPFTLAVRLTLNMVRKANLVAIGVNCIHPRHASSLMALAQRAICDFMLESAHDPWTVDTVLYPNSGEVWNGQDYTWSEPSEAIEQKTWSSIILATGARLIGGCCRIGPQEIQELCAASKSKYAEGPA